LSAIYYSDTVRTIVNRRLTWSDTIEVVIPRIGGAKIDPHDQAVLLLAISLRVLLLPMAVQVKVTERVLERFHLLKRMWV
jgi:hypothetical protein